jgi:hypothetical protein
VLFITWGDGLIGLSSRSANRPSQLCARSNLVCARVGRTHVHCFDLARVRVDPTVTVQTVPRLSRPSRSAHAPMCHATQSFCYMVSYFLILVSYLLHSQSFYYSEISHSYYNDQSFYNLISHFCYSELDHFSTVLSYSILCSRHLC